FNATLSGLLGMFLTPALAGVMAHTSGHELPLAKAIVDIVTKLLLPFAAGQLSRPVLAAFLERYRGWVSYVDRSVIVLIVYAAFCQSTQAGVWSAQGAAVIALVAALTALLLVTAIGLTVPPRFVAGPLPRPLPPRRGDSEGSRPAASLGTVLEKSRPWRYLRNSRPRAG